MTIGIHQFKIENALDHMSRLKGAPSLVLMLLDLAREKGLGPVKTKWLAFYSDYNGKTIAEALDRLEQYGLVKQVQPNLWQLSEEVGRMAQVWQTHAPDSAARDEAHEQPAAQEQEQPKAVEQPEAVEISTEENSAEEISTPKIFPPSSSSSYPDSFPESNPEILPTRSRPPKPEKIRDKSAVLAELDHFGIREPVRSRLAEMTHVTPQLVRGHCQSCQSTGQAIFRITHNWAIKGQSAVPKDWSAGLPDDSAGDAGANTEAPPPAECQAAWSAAVEQLRAEVSGGDFVSWVLSARLVEAGGPTWRAALANQFGVDHFCQKGWVERIGQILSEQRGRDTRVQMVVGY